MVRTLNGQIVAFSRLATVRKTEQVEFLDRLNMYPAVEVTANLTPENLLLRSARSVKR